MKHSLSPAWTFATKTPAEPITSDFYSPGPGTYQVSAFKPRISSIGNSKRPELYPDNRNPGPGQYTLASHFKPKVNRTRPEKAGKNMKDRPEKGKFEEPGPGTYNISQLHPGVGHSMGNKTHNLQNVPKSDVGPGTYDAGISQSVPFISFTKGKRQTSKEKAGPGPGAYDLPNLKSEACHTFPASKSTIGMNETPSPCQYDIPSCFDGKSGKTMGMKERKQWDLAQLPGPGHYNPQDFQTQVQMRIGKGKRQSFIQKQNPHIAPGKYELKSPEKTQAARIGRAIREMHKPTEPSPGPGQYNFVSQLAGPKHSFTKREFCSKIKFIVPGPGQYTPRNQAVAPQAFHADFGTSSRAVLEKNHDILPGPGHYNAGELRNIGWSFGKSSKENRVDTEDPGPGSYDV